MNFQKVIVVRVVLVRLGELNIRRLTTETNHQDSLC
mgnify:CR=1 FL=1